MEYNRNIYDIIGNFYDTTPPDLACIPQSLVEGFIRSEAFSGTTWDEEKALSYWQQLFLFMSYCGYTRYDYRDFDATDLVACVVWSARNLQDFIADYDTVSAFAGTMEKFMAYLMKKGVIQKGDEGKKAKELLLDEKDKKVLLIDKGGEFFDKKDEYRYSLPQSLPSKIFLRSNKRLVDLYDGMSDYFRGVVWRNERFRAGRLFVWRGGAMPNIDNPDSMDSTFRDYFIFDHVMARFDCTPLDWYRKLVDEWDKDISESQRALDKRVMDHIGGHQLRFFTMGSEDPYVPEQYECFDIFNGSSFMLYLPVDDPTPESDKTVYIAHVLEGGVTADDYYTMTYIEPVQKKQLLKIADRLKQIAAVRDPEMKEWNYFIRKNPALMYNLVAYFANTDQPYFFSWDSAHTEYSPAPIDESDRVVNALRALRLPAYISSADNDIICHMWADHLAAGGDDFGKEDDMTIAASLIAYYSSHFTPGLGLTRGKAAKIGSVTVGKVRAIGEAVEKTLAIEKYDPRYMNEEGLMRLFFEFADTTGGKRQ